MAKKTAELIKAVEDLHAIHCGKKAEGEQWGETIERIERLKKLARAAAKEIAKKATPNDRRPIP